MSALAILGILYSCASIGRLEGGPIDEDPPRFVASTPLPGELNSKRSKVTIEFDEFIKLDKPSEKIVVSPPQVQQPVIKSNGKKVTVTLQDSMRANTTYTIDFADAIQDNNESNPLSNFTFTFATGDVLDTMAVAGTVLNASNLEPVKGILVGLHSNLADTVLTTLPFERVGRTDSRHPGRQPGALSHLRFARCRPELLLFAAYRSHCIQRLHYHPLARRTDPARHHVDRLIDL